MTRWNEATYAQVTAADPTNSTWLTANAGSGKTRVLTDRVARLLLDGVDPQNILCLTYTKAAASEMQNRLFRRLGAWSMMADTKLATDLTDLGFEGEVRATDLSQARTLFAKAVETPGGLKIQTIHSFCASILRRFPLEARVSPAFAEMDDRQAQLLRADILDQLVEGESAEVVKAVLPYLNDQRLDALAGEVLKHRDKLGKGATTAEIGVLFDLNEDASAGDAVQIAFVGGEKGLVDDIIDASSGLTATYKKFGSELAQLRLDAPEFADLEALFSRLLYTDKTSKSRNFPQANHTKAVDAYAHLADDLHGWMDRTEQAYQHILTVQARDRTLALYDFAAAFIPAYEAAKLQRGLLDFDDLILKARDLLTNSGLAQWILYKLDGGIDHILVDEAQDTSPDQWTVVRALTQEFASGEGARADRKRTIFVVGDKKQSIYSFQGADPEGFDRMRHHFDDALNNIGHQLHVQPLQFSFRSSPAIMTVVDNTFVRHRTEGLEKEVFHRAFKDQMPGRVDMWPPVEPAEKEPPTDWTDPVDRVSEAHHDVKLANTIAQQIKSMIGQPIPEEIDNSGAFRMRPIREGDFLVLVRRRSTVFSEVIRACKAEGLRIAGADVLALGSELAVRDLLALLNFLALPEDDLSLAAALKSPLFGWTEQQLYAVAQGRKKGVYLWQEMRGRTELDAGTMEVLADLRKQSDFLRPFDLLSRILIRHGGRKKLIARLGDEAEDGIDALMARALTYESTAVPSLTGFLVWMSGDDAKIKRQVDDADNRIRVMTIHGSKGLEAPIVILPDTSKHTVKIRNELLPIKDRLIWKAARGDDEPETGQAARAAFVERQHQELRRLLYVAMTRAEKWLIVAASGEVGEGDDSWYSVVKEGLDHSGAVELDGPFGTGLRHEFGDWSGAVKIDDKDAPTTGVRPVLQPLPDAPKRREFLSPSDLGGAKIVAADLESDVQDKALTYGTLMHLLLERLPDCAVSDWATVGQALINGHSDAGLIDDPAALLQKAISVLNNPKLAHVFTRDTLSEVEVSATLPGMEATPLFGAIDRLVVSDDRVLIVDFKTNRDVPATAEAVPEGLLRQMGAYGAAIQQIFPDHRIEAAILWVATEELMELPDALTSNALGRVTVY